MGGLITILNGGIVSIFGSMLSAFFCDIFRMRRKRAVFLIGAVMLLAVQGIIYTVCEESVLWKVYPVISHLPLIVLLCILTGKPLWSAISVLTAYLCCQLRRWLALLIVAILAEGPAAQDLAELILTVPLFWILLHFVSPILQKLPSHSVKMQTSFLVIPFLYYAFDYLTRVYTDLLSAGIPVAVEFMPFVCCTAYLVFLHYNSKDEQMHSQFAEMQKSMNIQLTQAVREIDTLRETQELTRRYRHDMRHHLQYLSFCIENGQTDQALEYISGIYEEIRTQEIRQYCENEAANLILTAFAARAEKDHITLNVRGMLPDSIIMADKDLCVLLSNALENALRASKPFASPKRKCIIDVQFFVKGEKVFLQMVNPCRNDVNFRDGIPVTDREGHGIGVQSICAIVERYKGVYSFQVRDGRFILRVSF